MYHIILLTQNNDYMESFQKSILQYKAKNIKFYYFSMEEEVLNYISQSASPDLCLIDSKLALRSEGIKNIPNKVMLTENTTSKTELGMYMSMDRFINEVLRRASMQERMGESHFVNPVKDNEKKIIWLLDPNESDWSKNCYDEYVQRVFQMGIKGASINLERLKNQKQTGEIPNSHSLSKLLFDWICKGQQMEFLNSEADFYYIQGVDHPMDLEMLQPPLLLRLIEVLSANYSQIIIYSGLFSEGLSKAIIRNAGEIFLLSDQTDGYLPRLRQIESWLNQWDPSIEIKLFYTRQQMAMREQYRMAIVNHVSGRVK